jgi:ribosomal protein S27E
MKMPKLYAAVHQNAYGISVKLFLYSITEEMPMLEVAELVKHLKIDFEPDRDETLDICDANDMVFLDEVLGRVDSELEQKKHEYLDHEGVRCVLCGSEQIEWSSIETDAGHTWRDVRCPVCGAAWRDIYGIVEVQNLVGSTAES